MKDTNTWSTGMKDSLSGRKGIRNTQQRGKAWKISTLGEIYRGQPYIGGKVQRGMEDIQT